MNPVVDWLPCLDRLLTRLAIWHRDMQGGVLVTFALSLPVGFGVLGVATDYAVYNKTRSELQAAADAAAIAGAREIPLARGNPKQIASVVTNFATYQLLGKASSDNGALLTAGKLTLSSSLMDGASAVQVTISKEWQPFFLHFLNAHVTPVSVSAKARYVGRNNVCVLGLASKGSAVMLDKNARLTGNNCGVFSNSGDSAGLRVQAGAVLTATLSCSAGGVDVSGTINPAAITDCPPVPNPLAKRPPPDIGGCAQTNLKLDGIIATLD